jgi:hypothetical protein
MLGSEKGEATTETWHPFTAVPDVLTFAGLHAIACFTGVVGFHAVAFIPAVACVPADSIVKGAQA